MAKEFIKIRNEISEIQDLKLTIKAIEKISSGQLHLLRRKWQNFSLYRESLLEILFTIPKEDFAFPFFEEKSQRSLFLIFSSNKRLSGGLFFDLFYFLLKVIGNEDLIYIIGKFGQKIAHQLKIKSNLVIDDPPDLSLLVKKYLIPVFLKKKVGKIYLIYPEFKKIGLFLPRMEKYLPLKREILEKKKIYKGYVYYEPRRAEILKFLIEDYLEVTITEKFLETKFCEFLARTITMEKANKRIEKIVQSLKLSGFKMKKREITKNITDLYSIKYYS